VNATRKPSSLPDVTPVRAPGRITQLVRVWMAIGMICQAAVLMKLSGMLGISFQTPGEGGLWSKVWLCALGSAAAFAGSALLQKRVLIGNTLAGAGCTLAWSYCLFIQPWAFFASQLSATVFVLPLFVFLPISSVLTLRDIISALRSAAIKAAGIDKSEPHTLGEIIRKLEETEYFVPAIYALQGILLSSLPLLPSLDKPFSFTQSLWRSGAPWSENFFYLPMAAGALLLAASFLRNSERGASGTLALQGTLAGFWFGIFTFLSLADTLVYTLSPSQNSTSGSFGTGAVDAVLLALFFSPLFFTFFYALKDLRQMENAKAILMRLMAGFCAIAVLRLFGWEETENSVGVSLFLIFGCGVYLLTAFHPPSIYVFAAGAAATCSLLALMVTFFFFLFPDFSGQSPATRHRSDLLLLLLGNAALGIASAVALNSRSSRQQIPA
jgi:hypothetical protein